MGIVLTGPLIGMNDDVWRQTRAKLRPLTLPPAGDEGPGLQLFQGLEGDDEVKVFRCGRYRRPRVSPFRTELMMLVLTTRRV